MIRGGIPASDMISVIADFLSVEDFLNGMLPIIVEFVMVAGVARVPNDQDSFSNPYWLGQKNLFQRGITQIEEIDISSSSSITSLDASQSSWSGSESSW